MFFWISSDNNFTCKYSDMTCASLAFILPMSSRPMRKMMMMAFRRFDFPLSLSLSPRLSFLGRHEASYLLQHVLTLTIFL